MKKPVSDKVVKWYHNNCEEKLMMRIYLAAALTCLSFYAAPVQAQGLQYDPTDCVTPLGWSNGPSNGFSNYNFENRCNAGIVLYIKDGSKSVLFTGSCSANRRCATSVRKDLASRVAYRCATYMSYQQGTKSGGC